MTRGRPGTCVLCGLHTTALQDEDVFPKWARNLLKNELAATPVDGQWPPKVLVAACEDCNHGLGSEFENPVAPILKPLARGHAQTLNREQMGVIAAWARLKDIEYVLARPYLLTADGQVPFNVSNFAYWRQQLAELRATRRPPRGYVVRLAIVGSPDDATPHRPFLPEGWRREQAHMTSINSVGHLVIESVRTTQDNAAAFIAYTKHDTRATLVWPRLRKLATVGTRTVPLDHADRWRDEHVFHPDSGLGGGWRLPIARDT